MFHSATIEAIAIMDSQRFLRDNKALSAIVVSVLQAPADAGSVLPSPVACEIIRDATIYEDESLSSPAIGRLHEGQFVNITEVKVMEDIGRVRARLEDRMGISYVGGWISLMNLETGECWANPVPRGVYEVLHDIADRIVARHKSLHPIWHDIADPTAIVAGDLGCQEQAIPVVAKGSYVHVCEVRVVEEIGRLCGRLLSNGWIPLASLDHTVRWATPVQLGAYKITHDGTAIGSDINHSSTIARLQKGQYVNVADVKIAEHVARVRARLDSGGWITLVNYDTGESTWASPVQDGLYDIVRDVTVNETESLDSLRRVEHGMQVIIESGQYVRVVEVKAVHASARLRGRLAAGGWISLMNLENGENTWASPVPLGVYRIISKSTVNEGADNRSNFLAEHEEGEYVRIVETKLVAGIARIRGRLSDGGWISLVNLGNRDKTWAIPVQLGAYKVTHDSALTETAEINSLAETDKVERNLAGETLHKGQYVDVVELKIMPDIARIRARVSDGGWMSLVNMATCDSKWANPVQVGAYLIVGETIVTELESPESTAVGSLFQGQYVTVNEVRVVDGVARVQGNIENVRVRGRLTSGGWISLVYLDRAEKFWPAAVPLGAYELAHESDEAALKVTEEDNVASQVVATIHPGQYVNVTETKVRCARVRGRLAGGGWASLANLESGEKTWLFPVQLGTYAITHKLVVSERDCEDSLAIAVLHPGQYAHVAESKVMELSGKVRARLTSGGWISLVNLANGEKLATPVVPTGDYMASPNRNSSRRHSHTSDKSGSN